MSARPRIALSVSIQAPDPDRELFANKPLHYVEAGMCRAVAEAGGLPLLVPDLGDESLADDVMAQVQGLLLTGGEDLAPESYGEEALRPEWGGDRSRDLYELSLLHAAVAAGLPVLGICRGCQLLNVGLGGSLWQDLETQVPGALRHRDPELYDALAHEVEILGGTRCARVLGAGSRELNSVHHQGLHELGQGLVVAARAPDGVIEAVEAADPERFLLGLQWHPEWLASPDPMLEAFVVAAAAR